MVINMGDLHTAIAHRFEESGIGIIFIKSGVYGSNAAAHLLKMHSVGARGTCDGQRDGTNIYILLKVSQR